MENKNPESFPEWPDIRQMLEELRPTIEAMRSWAPAPLPRLPTSRCRGRLGNAEKPEGAGPIEVRRQQDQTILVFELGDFGPNSKGVTRFCPYRRPLTATACSR